MKICLALSIAVSLFLAMISTSSHATPVVSPAVESPLTYNPNGTSVYGWEFSLTSALTLDKLGFYDEGQDGLAESHQIGLWTTTGTLISSATISSGTSNPLDGFFRMVDVSDVLLNVGTSYVIGATNIDVDRMVRDPSNLIIQPGIIYNAARYAYTGGALSLPTTSTSHNGYFGPTFSVVDTNVVETSAPATLALIGLGLAGLSFSRRKSS